MIFFPNAKINLGLNIVSKREDGYHDIESIFYPVGWKDILEVVESKQVSFESSGIEIPGSPSQNLCLRAYHLIKKDFDIPSVHIHLHKVIPIGAGLGGGSSDAAFTLKALNQLFSLQLTNAQLENYAKQLGSDCAFFIENRPVFAFEKGDVFENQEVNIGHLKLVLINPNIHISTAEAYAGVSPASSQVSIKKIVGQPINTWKDVLKNDFENSVANKYPMIAALKSELYKLGALYASMTGSGSTVYGIFDKIPALSFPKSYTLWTNDEM